MGISGLLGLLKEAQESVHVSKHSGKRAAVAAWCPPMMQTAGIACDEAEPTAETPEPDGEVAQAA